MKKLVLVFLVMMSLLSLLAADQGITVTVGQDITVVINPTTVNFGSVLPDTNANGAVEDVSFDATGSNVDVNVEVTTVSGEPFTSGLKFDGTLAQGQDILLPCVLSGDLCTYVLEIVDTTLDVPDTFKKGVYPGTITYTITEAVV
ncbi:MAG: hypothetical protein AABW88_05120 [Nanoarchaeota archaeon]